MSSGTRERLLDAAIAVVRGKGAQALTLEAVAAEAGVSKGGLLYHFKSKRELLDALVARWLGEWQDEIERAAPARGFEAAYVQASHLGEAGESERAAEFGLLAALIAEPDALEVVRERYAVWQQRLEREASDPVEATIVRLAADGLWLADLLRFAPPQGALREQVLLRLTRQSTR